MFLIVIILYTSIDSEKLLNTIYKFLTIKSGRFIMNHSLFQKQLTFLKIFLIFVYNLS